MILAGVEEAIANERPSLILLRRGEPDRNGFQICRELKSNSEFNTIPVILGNEQRFGKRQVLGSSSKARMDT